MLLSRGRLIDPAAGVDGLRDVLVIDGTVEAFEPAGSLRAPADVATIKADGCWILPGLIDPHVHLRDPGFPEKETIATGLAAAAAGGFTAVAAMANTLPVNDTPEITRYMLDRAREAHGARLVPVAAVSRGLLGREPVDYPAMAQAGAHLFSDDGAPIDDQLLLMRAMDEIRRLGFAISLHEEDRTISGGGAVNAGKVAKRLGVKGVPGSAESRRIRRDLALAPGTEAAVHVAHVSTAQSVDLIRAARKNGANVTCEITPHHFALDENSVLRWGPNAKMSPPLRCRDEVEALREAIADRTIDMIASDHAPHDPESKQIARLGEFFDPARDSGRLPEEQAEALGRAANGIVGLETALGLALDLVHRSLIDPPRLVEMMSVNPARLLRLEAGTLALGASADITVVDPALSWTVEPSKFLSKSRNTPFAGMRLKGRAVLTVVAGEIAYDARPSRVS